MADDLTFTTTVATAPSGTVVATDEIGGKHYQRVKVTAGADGTATDVTIGGGVEAAALRVTIASDSTGVLSVDDNGASLTVDNAALSVTGGGVEASALRVTLANDSTGVLSVDDNGGSLTVDVGTALPAGTNAIGKLAANSGVDIGDVDVTSVTPGTTATALGKAEDAAHTTGDVGVMALTVRQNTAAALSGTDADYQPLITDTNGRLHVVNSAGVAGDVAHDAADSGNPVKAGAVARTTNPTAVANGDRVNLSADDNGRLLVIPYGARDLVAHQHTEIASSSSETTIVTAAGANVFADLVSLVLTNQTATAVVATIKDSTAGTTRMKIALAANGGAVMTFPAPVVQATANNNWTCTLSSAAVTVDIFAQYVKNN